MRSFPFSFVSLVFLAAQGASGSAFAAGAVSIKSVDFSGGGCSAADSSGVLSPSGDFEVRFTNLFAAAAAPEPNAASECDVEVGVQPPRGFALAINGATLEGAARAQQAVASVIHSYAIESSRGVFSTNENVWDTASDPVYDGVDIQPFTQAFGPGFSDPADIPADWRGQCGALTHVRGHLRLDANLGAGGSAEIYADRSRLAGTSSLQWDWELVPCGSGSQPQPTDPGLAGSWRFSYLAGNGRTVTGRMSVVGDAGSYRALGANWTGQLKDLHAEAGRVKGTWGALGEQGWVEFTPDDDGLGFHGEWGYVGAAAVGFWNGQKE